MAVLIAPGICRFTLHGTIHDRPWANVIDMHIETGIAGSRADSIADQAQVLLNEWIDHIRPLLTPQAILTEVTWVDLNAADGTVGNRSDASSPRVMPSAGSNPGDAMPGNVAILVTKRTNGGRGARNGRMFLPGVDESDAVGSNFSGGNASAAGAALGNFLSGVNQSDSPVFDYSSHMAVVQTSAGAFVAHHNVVGLAVQTRLATQRRRLRG